MKLRVRFGERRFDVHIGDENPTVLALKEAICNTISVRDISSLKISLNGTDVIDGDDTVRLASHGLVNGDLIYVLSSAVPERPAVDHSSRDGSRANKVLVGQLVEMGFNKGEAEHALEHVNNTSVDAALTFLSDNEPMQDTTCNVSCDKPEVNSSNLINQQMINNSSITAGPSSTVASTIPSVGYEPEKREETIMNVPNPVFCRDGISTALASMYDKGGVNTQHKALFVIIHAIMLESGFQSKNVSKDSKNLNAVCEEMPVGWNEKGVSKLQYLHNLCPSLVCQVVFSSLGPFVYGHAWFLDENSGCHQVKLVVSQYVRGDVSLSSGAKAVYRNLHEVSRLVKDCLVHPLLAAIRSHLGLTTPFSLIGLPPETQLMIFSLLDARSVVRLCCSCKGLYCVCNDAKLWNFFCQRDFGIEKKSFSSWKEQYKALYRQRHAQRHRTNDGLFTHPQSYPGIPVSNPFLPRRPRYPPGIIGGPSDLFPDFMNMQPQDTGMSIPQNVPSASLSAFPRRTRGSGTRTSFPH